MNTNKIEIKLLADHPESLSSVAHLWYEELGKQWIPNASIERATEHFATHLNSNNLPLTYIATHQDQVIGTASLRINDGFDGLDSSYTPWLGSLIVSPEYRGQGIAQQLINTVIKKAHQFDYAKIYLLTFDETLPIWYALQGWEFVKTDKYFGHSITIMMMDI